MLVTNKHLTFEPTQNYSQNAYTSQSIIATLQKGEKKSLDELYSYALVIMSGRLFELGFFEKFNDLSGPEKQKAVFDMTRRLLPHQIGHFVGMDVHDWSNEGSPGMSYRKDSFLVFVLVNVQLS